MQMGLLDLSPDDLTELLRVAAPRQNLNAGNGADGANVALSPLQQIQGQRSPLQFARPVGVTAPGAPDRAQSAIEFPPATAANGTYDLSRPGPTAATSATGDACSGRARLPPGIPPPQNPHTVTPGLADKLGIRGGSNLMNGQYG